MSAENISTAFPEEVLLTETGGRPLGDRVLLSFIPVEEISQGGIYIPDTAKKRPSMGTALAVGDGRKIAQDGSVVSMPMPVKVGERVLFSEYSGIEIRLHGVDMCILASEDILMVLDEGVEAE